MLKRHIYFDIDQKATAIDCLASVLSCGLGDRGIVVRLTAAVRDFYQIQCVQTSSVAHPPSMRTKEESLFVELRRQGCEADHSPPSNTALSVRCATLALLHTRAPAVSFDCGNESGGRNFETCDLIS
jgi:hypothetical protein